MDKDKTLTQVQSHYTTWTDDNDIRTNRKNGWNDITSAYWGKLPDNWPYNTKVVDPRIRTTIIEKNARLLNSKLRGRLVPREGGDIIKARICNAKLDFDWDSANYGGTMLYKWKLMDMDTRMYASKFGLTYWKTKYQDDKLTFEGNEFMPLDIRNCGIDGTSDGIRNAKWFQYRRWEKVEDLQEEHKTSGRYNNLSELIGKIKNDESYNQDRKDTRYDSKTLSLKGLSDHTGDDDSFPVVEIVTEYREDRFITFSPRHNVILEDIKNPYKHRKIPVVQLKYYPLNDDPLGESEVEPVLPIWRAIQAVLCAHLDGIDLRQKPPVMIMENAVRMETIVLGPEAKWIVTNMDAIQEAPLGKATDQSFQTDYSALVAAFNSAMGDLSQGVSAVDPFNPDKTATEIRASAAQQNTRDQSNQTSLAEAIEDMMSMWLSNNKQFLFEDPTKQDYLLKILGDEQYGFFKQSGLDQMETPDEVMNAINDIITASDGQISDADLQNMIDAGKVPKYPVVVKEGKGKKAQMYVKPKMTIAENGGEADITMTPEDLQGTFDYIADVSSMAAGANEEMRMGQEKIMEAVMNPSVQQLLAIEGVKIKIKDILINTFENYGAKDAQRFFETIEQPAGPNVLGAGQTAGVPNPDQILGMAGPSASVPQGNAGAAVAQPSGLPQQQTVPGGVPGGISGGAGGGTIPQAV